MSFIQVIMAIIGATPISYDISYGGDTYIAPEIITPMYIVEDGDSDFVVVTADDADECIGTAASELTTYIKRISGAQLQTVTESEYTGGKAIFLGETSTAEAITSFDRTSINHFFCGALPAP